MKLVVRWTETAIEFWLKFQEFVVLWLLNVGNTTAWHGGICGSKVAVYVEVVAVVQFVRYLLLHFGEKEAFEWYKFRGSFYES